MEPKIISELRQQIDSVFGEESLMIPGIDKQIVDQVTSSDEYVDFSEDQIYQWIIRGFLINAELQGYLNQERKAEYLERSKTTESRRDLAAAIIFAAVPFANSLPPISYVQHDEVPGSPAH